MKFKTLTCFFLKTLLQSKFPNVKISTIECLYVPTWPQYYFNNVTLEMLVFNLLIVSVTMIVVDLTSTGTLAQTDLLW